MQFVEKQSVSTDVFCFQEMFDTTSQDKTRDGYRINLLNELKTMLGDFECLPALAKESAYVNDPENKISFGLTTFVRHPIKVVGQKIVPIYKGNDESSPRNIQHITLKNNQQPCSIFNVHGLWFKEGKLDNPDRVTQSKIIIENFRATQGKKILCGDFNLLPENQSVKMIEQETVNLISKNKITSTRSKYYLKKDKFADYIFISIDINDKQFRVLPDVVSDHLAMELIFE